MHRCQTPPENEKREREVTVLIGTGAAAVLVTGGAFQLSQIPQFASNRTSFEFPILASGLRGQHRFLLAKISLLLSYRHGKSFWKAIRVVIEGRLKV